MGLPDGGGGKVSYFLGETTIFFKEENHTKGPFSFSPGEKGKGDISCAWNASFLVLSRGEGL